MNRTEPEHGFTLVEVLVTVVVMTIIIVGITAGLMVVLKTYPSDATRLTQDEGSQLLSTWLQGDALSASNIDRDVAVNGCPGSPLVPTTKLLLTWSDFDHAHTFQATYVLSPLSGSPAVGTLTRNYSVDGGSPTQTKVGRNVESACASVTGQQVTFVVTESVGTGGSSSSYTYTVSASGRTPPSTTSTSSTSTTSTSTTSTSTTTTTAQTTTTMAPGCTVSPTPTVSPQEVALKNKGQSGQLSAAITLAGQATGTCGPLKYSVDTGDGHGVQTKPLPTCGSCTQPLTTWSLQIDAGAFSWTAGPHPFSILDASGVVLWGNISFTVDPAS